MSIVVIIYGEEFQNTPFEKAGVFIIGSLFLAKGVKIQLEKVKNVEHISNDGNFPLFSIDSKLYSGIENSQVIMDDMTNKINNKGDQNIQGKSLSERIKFHNEIVQFNYVKCFFSNLLLYEEWISSKGYGISSALYETRFSWPLNKLLLKKKRTAVDNVFKYSYFKNTKEELIREFETFCMYLNNKLGNQLLVDKLQMSELDLLIYGYITIINAYPNYFESYIEILNRCPQINELLIKINDTNGNILAFWKELHD